MQGNDDRALSVKLYAAGIQPLIEVPRQRCLLIRGDDDHVCCRRQMNRHGPQTWDRQFIEAPQEGPHPAVSRQSCLQPILGPLRSFFCQITIMDCDHGELGMARQMIPAACLGGRCGELYDGKNAKARKT